MAMSFSMQDDVGVYTTIGDVVYAEGLQVLQNGLQALRLRGEPYRILFDIRESREHRNADEFRAIANIIQQQPGIAAIALVASTDEYFGISRMFEAYTELKGMEVEAFHEIGLARAWLRDRT